MGGMVGGPDRRRQTGRPRCRCVDNINVDLFKIGWSEVDWTRLAQDRNMLRALVTAVMNFRVHKMLAKYRVATKLVAS
jgi:hypothetical protein